LHSGAKIAIGGKGGVGKTTICAVWAELFSREGFDVLAIDADCDANLGAAFGLARGQSPQPLIEMKQLIQQRTGTWPESVGAYFRLNPKVSDLPEKYWVQVRGLKLLVLGGPRQAGGGCACPEAAFLRALLTHTILQRKELILVDLAAGVEFMGRASVQGIDAMVVVVEPGARSIETAVKIVKMAGQMGIRRVAAIANKLTEAEQIEVIRAGLEGVRILGAVSYLPALVRAEMKGEPVFEASVELVNQLAQAKAALVNLISSNVCVKPADARATNPDEVRNGQSNCR
jgi:CO dehydrogenase maturation factor